MSESTKTAETNTATDLASQLASQLRSEIAQEAVKLRGSDHSNVDNARRLLGLSMMLASSHQLSHSSGMERAIELAHTGWEFARFAPPSPRPRS